MSKEIEFKVCGIKTREVAEACAAAGASYLGFNFYPKSIRCISPSEYADLAGGLPKIPKVAVTVSSSDAELAELKTAGFDFFQIHFPLDQVGRVPAWSAQVGKDALWLAPKLPSSDAFDPAWLESANGILWDGFKKDADVFGGTGHFSDWEAFRRLQGEFPDTRWILAGGLSPENAEQAIRESGAQILDFNSALESEPGVKDPKRILQVENTLSALRHR